MLACEVLVIGLALIAFGKRVPSAQRASRTVVAAVFDPKQPTWSARRVSTVMRITSGPTDLGRRVFAETLTASAIMANISFAEATGKTSTASRIESGLSPK